MGEQITYPLIVTVRLDVKAFLFFNELRQRYFPGYLNFLEAHLTLFHHLPDLPVVKELLQEEARVSHFSMDIIQVKKSGNAVVFVIESPALMQLHARLQRKLSPFLLAQDRQGLWPHITIHNKGAYGEAERVYREVAASFQPFTIKAQGLETWLYLGGPWQVKDYHSFGRALVSSEGEGMRDEI